jgi:polar amino acid transport system substrate-binding protein
MKQILTVVVLVLFLLPAAAAPGQGEELVAATGEWAPYVSQHLENRGFITQILSDAFSAMGVEVRFVFYPWRRCYESVVSHRVWAAFPYSRTEERAEQVNFSDVVSYSVTKFFVYGPPDIEVYTGPASLKSYRIGGVIGYFYEEDFRRQGLTVDYASRESSAIEMLMKGRTDLLPLNELVGWRIIRNRFPQRMDRFRVLEPPYSKDPLHLIVSKTYPGGDELLERFNRALQIVKNNYIYDGILERYTER